MKKSILLLGIAVVVVVGNCCEAVHSAMRSVGRRPLVRSGPRDADQQGVRHRGRLSGERVVYGSGCPGTLSGKWRASGKGGNDALSGFTLTDPSDAVLDSSFKGSSGASR